MDAHNGADAHNNADSHNSVDAHNGADTHNGADAHNSEDVHKGADACNSVDGVRRLRHRTLSHDRARNQWVQVSREVTLGAGVPSIGRRDWEGRDLPGMELNLEAADPPLTEPSLA